MGGIFLIAGVGACCTLAAGELSVVRPLVSQQGAVTALQEKLLKLELPAIQITNMSLGGALGVIQDATVRADVEETDPVGRGVKIVMDSSLAGSEKKFTLSLARGATMDLLQQLSEAVGAALRVDENQVTVVPPGVNGNALYTRLFKTPKNLLPTNGGGWPGSDDPFSAVPVASGRLGNEDPFAWVHQGKVLTSKGVDFPPGVWALWDADTGHMLVHNTAANLQALTETSKSMWRKQAAEQPSVSSPPSKLEDYVVSLKPPDERLVKPDLAVAGKLRSLKLDQLSLQQATLHDALEVLRRRIRDMDPGMNFEIQIKNPAFHDGSRVSLDLRNVSLIHAIKEVSMAAGGDCILVGRQVLVVPESDPAAFQWTKTYRVPNDFLRLGPKGEEPVTPEDVLLAEGILFPAGSKVAYSSETHHLTVRNTPRNLELVDQFVVSMWSRRGGK